jgi:heme exporter protein B
MFLLVTIAVITFSVPGEKLAPSTLSAFFWIALFFGAMTGLSRSFISEEERGTGFLLRAYAPADGIFLAKLSFNLMLTISLSLAGTLAFLFFFKDFIVNDWPMFMLQMLLGAVGVASTSTILSALIGRAVQKGALLPVIALPVLMPLVIATTDATRITLETVNSWDGIRGDVLILFSFDMAITLVSYVLFAVIWND